MVYVPGALPSFEGFGSLPTNVVREDGLVHGEPASEALDMIIIPGGSLVESQSVKGDLMQEIIRMADAGKFVLGICSGFQVLATATDIGRLSSTPIIRHGLGLLDVEFKPSICTDRVTATVLGKSFMTDTIGKEVSGFHCHTYGKMILPKETKPILVSHIQRINYHNDPQPFISGFTNKDGNIVGVLIHALLDENPSIIQSIIRSLDVNPQELQKMKAANSKLLMKIKGEVGISTSVRIQNDMTRSKEAAALLLTATGSGTGKTFIVTGIAGALKKKGINVGVIKVGGDIRDIVPALYLIKEPIKNYSSIRIGASGWKSLDEVVEDASQNYDFLLIEGAMGALTGLFNDEVKRPYSTVEVALAIGAPMIIVVSCEKEGIEGAVTSALNYVNLLKNLGIKIKGVILNKARVSYMTDEIRLFIKHAFENLGVELLGIVPRIELEGRGMIPEIEIRYEEFGTKAIDAVEGFLDLKTLVEIATPPAKVSVDYKTFLEKFKFFLINGCNCDVSNGGSREG